MNQKVHPQNLTKKASTVIVHTKKKIFHQIIIFHQILMLSEKTGVNDTKIKTLKNKKIKNKNFISRIIETLWLKDSIFKEKTKKLY